MNLSHESDLMKIIDSDKLSEIQGNHRLREFYKKLVQTDGEIRKLKKDYLFNAESPNRIPYPDRAKRSLDMLKNPFRMFHPKKKTIKEITEEGKPTEAAKVKEPNTEQENKVKIKETTDARVKRFDTNEDGLLIEKKKVSIHFVPNGRRTFKCPHAPTEINSYEKPVKNPFYQNSQRLDELLDKFLDKNDMDMLGEPYSRSMMAMKKSQHKNLNIDPRNGAPTRNDKTENDEIGDFEVNFNDAKNKLLKNAFRNNNKNIQHFSVDENLKSLDDQITKSKIQNDHFNKNRQQTDLDSLQEFLDSHGGAARAKVKPKGKGKMKNDNNKKEMDMIKGYPETTTSNYDLLMSISTMMFKDFKNPLPAMKKLDDSNKVKDRAPVGRRLMQIEMDDDEEVSVMPAREQDGGSRMRREEEMNPNNIINRNWKGPMPLYPDEFNAVNKPSTNKENPYTQSMFSGPKNRRIYSGFRSQYTASDLDPIQLTDVEYIEDYFRNKYNKVTEMAQAYSDYGVLNEKSIKKQRVDQRFRNYAKVDSDKPGIKLHGMDKNFSWASPEEGFKLELFPSSSRLDGFMKSLNKHVKFTGTPKPETLGTDTTLEAFFASHTFETTTGATEVLDVKNILKFEKPLEFEYRNFKKRSLKSVDYYQNDDQSDAIDSLMNFRGIFNGLQKKFSTKLGSAQDYAIRVASDYIHDGIYKRDVDSVDVDVNDNITVSNNITDIYNATDAVKLVANDTANATAQIETGVKIATDVHNDTGATLSDFFMKVAHWFSLLDALDLSANKSQQGNFSNNTTEKAKDQMKFEVSFPLYNANMIENIGHRSRVLLAVNETGVVDDRTTDGDGKSAVDTKDVGVGGTEVDNTTTINLETVDANANVNKTKSIVKRNADGNLLWDDVYNADYGTDADKIDGSDASKNVQDDGNKLAEKRHPKDWFKKIFNRIMVGAVKSGPKHGCEDKESGHCKCGEEGKPTPKKPKPIQNLRAAASRRFYRKADEHPMEEKKTDFTALTAKMKKICQKAAKDISLSKKLEVREESKEGQVASKLMQQLIGLMSDLVDYQVHEKTCRKLPMDLQNFLEWLTNPDSTVMTYHGKDVILTQSNKEPIEEIHSLEAVPPEEELEPKADCMAVISAVRDLINRYDSLSDDDKSKMSGVREYLEAQVEYLQKQMYMTNDINVLNSDISRYKRNTKVSRLDPIHNIQESGSRNNHPGKVKSVYVTFRKYMRNKDEGNKHPTKKLHASEDHSTTGKVMTVSLAVGKVLNKMKPENEIIKKITKPKLKDVVYRALEEAKLMTAASVEAKLTTVLPPKTTDY